MPVRCPNCQTLIYNARSTDANRYYWGVIVQILAEHFGYLDSEMHEELKIKFNPKQSKLNSDLHYGGTTTELSPAEFNEYCERIRVWALSDYGINIPLPNLS